MKQKLAIVNNMWEKFTNTRVLKTIFLFFPKNFLLFILSLIGFFVMFFFWLENKDHIIYEENNASGIIEPILVNEVNLNLKELDINERFNKVCVRFATYNRVNNSSFKFDLLEGENIKKEILFNSKDLADGEFYCFDIQDSITADIKQYDAKIIPIFSDSDNAITIYKNEANNLLNIRLIANTRLMCWSNVLIGLFVIIYLLLNYFVNTKIIKPEKFWLLCLLYIVPILFIIPPWQVPDERAHFFRAYGVSQLDIKNYKDNIMEKDIMGPSNIMCLNYSKIQVLDKVNSTKEIYNCWKNSKTNESLKYLLQRFLTINSALPYMFSSLGIKIADFFSNSSLMIFYIGRIFNLIISIFLIYSAIKIAPKYKGLFLVVGTIPMFIQQMISYSYDSPLNSLCLLLLAVCFKQINDNKIVFKKNFALLTILSLAIALIKPIYLPILVVLLFQPVKHKSDNSKKYLYIISILIISLGLMMIINSIPQIDINSGMGDQKQLKYLMENPAKIFLIAFNTFKINGWFYFRSLFGYFGWFKFRLNDIFIISYIIIFIYIILGNEKKHVVNKKFDKFLYIIGLLIAFAAPFGAMYLYWSQYKLSYVDGVQGRYFIPLLIPLAFFLMPKKKMWEEKIKNIYLFINIIMLQYIVVLISYYY